MITSKNIEAFLGKALKEIELENQNEIFDSLVSVDSNKQLHANETINRYLNNKLNKPKIDLKEELRIALETEKSISNVVSITSKEKASESKAEPKLVKLFEYLPAAASSKESEYKWYHFQCEIKDNEGNKSILKMKPKGKEADKNVKLEFIPSTHNSMLDVDESYLGKWVPLVIKVADKILIEGEVFIYANKDKLIGRGKIVESEFPDTSVEPIEYFIENKL